MLLSEMVRKIADEEVLYNLDNPVAYAGLHDWTTRYTANVTLTKQKIVYVKFTGYAEAGAGGNVRVLLGSTPLVSCGKLNYGEEATREVFLLLPAGSYTFYFQTSQYRYETNYANKSMKITKIVIATLDFSDTSHNLFNSGTVAAANGTTTTVLNQNFTLSSGRKTCIGTVKNYTVLIVLNFFGVDKRVSKVKNSGESAESGFLNWTIEINGAQASFTDRRDDYDPNKTDYPAYAEGAYGFIVTVWQANTTNNVKVKVNNLTGAAANVQAQMAIIACPWFLANTDYEPVTLNFPQGSTLYLVLEPLTADPTKTVKIGKKRFVSFGDSTDHYYTTSGTGILQANYTFETVEVAGCVLLVSGYGGCISIIGVDVR